MKEDGRDGFIEGTQGLGKMRIAGDDAFCLSFITRLAQSTCEVVELAG